MIQVFCNERGPGKTKELISLANEKANEVKGDSIYINDDFKNMRQIDRKIRFISTEDFEILDCNSVYGLLCGVVSENYDVENIYIDGVFDLFLGKRKALNYLFKKIDLLAKRYNLNVYINLSYKHDSIPGFVKEYIV